MLIDGHMHLEHGPLTIEYAMEFVNAGVSMGLDEIQILDHTHRFIEFSPLYEKLKQTSAKQKEWLEKKQLEPLSTLVQLMKEMKQMDLPIKVKWGLEVCFDPDQTEFLRNLFSQYAFDFLIGSIHSIDGRLYDMPFSKELLWDQFDVDMIYRRYYEIMEEMIVSDVFTQIGHPDQLKLFHYEPSYDLTSTYEHLSDLAVQHDVFMEHNTGIHYRYQHDDLGTNPLFLSIMKERGVKIMTASDAHQPQHVGKFIKEASEQIKQI